MNRGMRRFCQIGVALLLVLGAVVTLVLWRGGEMLRAELEAQLQARLVPTVRLGAPLEWQLHPQPQVMVRDVSLVDASGTTVARLAELRVTLDGAGLTEGRLEVAALDVDGLELTLKRDAGGGWDVTGWLRAAPDDAAATPMAAIGRIRLVHGRVRIVGEPGAEITDIELNVAPLRLGGQGEFTLGARADVPSAAVSAVRVDAAGQFLADLDQPRLEHLQLQAVGEIGAWSVSRAVARAARVERVAGSDALKASGLTLDLAAAAEAGQIDARVALATLSGSGTSWRGEGLDAQVRGEQAQRVVSATLQAAEVHADASGWALPAMALEASSSGTAPAVQLTLAGAAQFDTGEGPAQLALTVAKGRAVAPHPADATATLALTWSGGARYDFATGSGAGELAGSFDQSRFDGRWAYEPLAPSLLQVNATLDRLDLDRYLPAGKADAAPGAALDLAPWRNWPVSADLRVGELRVRGFVSKQARLRLGEGATAGR